MKAGLTEKQQKAGCKLSLKDGAGRHSAYTRLSLLIAVHLFISKYS